jgi:ankyrin repeat protein
MSSGVARKDKSKFPLQALPNELLLEVADRLKRFRDLHALLRTCRFFKTLFHSPLYRRAVTASDTVRDDIARWVLTKYRIAPLIHLLDNGLSVNHKFRDGRDLLHTLCGSRQKKHPVPKMVQLLLERGADIEAKDETTSSTVLHWLISKGSQVFVALLLAHGADVNAATVDGVTPLHQAVASSANYYMTTILLTHGADVNAADKNGSTPLHLAIRKKSPGIVALLLAHGADAKAANVDGITPLHHAASTGNCDTATFLLAHGADVNAACKNGKTPLHRAVENSHYKLASLLLAHGADAKAVDGFSVEHESIRRRLESAQFLTLTDEFNLDWLSVVASTLKI